MADLTQDADEGINDQVESVLRAHAGKVEGILTGMGFPPHVAGPAVNDALLALVRARRKGIHVAKPKAFLIRVGIRSAINALRPLRERNEIPGSDLISDVPGRADDLSLIVMLQMDVRQGLGQLSQRQREALTLCDMCDLSREDAARIMGVTVAGVESSLRRGRERLRQIMLEQGYQPRKPGQERGEQPGKEATR